MTVPGWEDLLDKDESILWQGKPVIGIALAKLFDMQAFVGIFALAFGIFWVRMAPGMVDNMRNAPEFIRFFPLFGLIFIAMALNQIIGRHLWAAYVQHGTQYTLTTKAAYIATQPFGKRRLDSFALDRMTAPTLIDTTPGSVHFATRQYLQQRGVTVGFGPDRPGGIHDEDVGLRIGPTHTSVMSRPFGFDRIVDARKVYRLVRDARSGAQDAAQDGAPGGAQSGA